MVCVRHLLAAGLCAFDAKTREIGGGFKVAAIPTPVAVWQGGGDRMVSMAHGAWLAGHIPGAQPHLLPDEGHLSLATNRLGDVLDGLLSMAGTSSEAARPS